MKESQPMSAKNLIALAVIIVIGALLGTAVGKFVGLVIPPESNWHSLFVDQITAGLTPTNIDLQLIEITFGCLLKFNLTSVIGIIIAAILYRAIVK